MNTIICLVGSPKFPLEVNGQHLKMKPNTLVVCFPLTNVWRPGAGVKQVEIWIQPIAKWVWDVKEGQSRQDVCKGVHGAWAGPNILGGREEDENNHGINGWQVLTDLISVPWRSELENQAEERGQRVVCMRLRSRRDGVVGGAVVEGATMGGKHCGGEKLKELRSQGYQMNHTGKHWNLQGWEEKHCWGERQWARSENHGEMREES